MCVRAHACVCVCVLHGHVGSCVLSAYTCVYMYACVCTCVLCVYTCRVHVCMSVGMCVCVGYTDPLLSTIY